MAVLSASAFPGSPWLLKGGLVVFEAKAPVPTNVIVFQYNPDSMSRTVRPEVEYDYNRRTYEAEVVNVLPPIESFQLSVELDAADQLEASNPIARVSGLHPTLSALELLLYPRSQEVVTQNAQELMGMRQFTTNRLPVVLLVWGAPRVVPVRVSSLSITEEAFDQLLNPIRARVELGLEALSKKDLENTAFAKLELVRHVAKEVLARTNLFNSAGQLGGVPGL